jgi:hypothetical protein
LFAPKPGRLLHILSIGAHAVVQDNLHYVSLTPKLARRLQLPPEHLFDYFSDPLETHNQVGRQAAAARALGAHFDGFISQYGDYLREPPGQARRKLTAKEKKSLETLGYL